MILHHLTPVELREKGCGNDCENNAYRSQKWLSIASV
jgi:hypothetical protein